MLLIKYNGPILILALVCLTELTWTATTTTSFLSASERSRLHQVFTASLDGKDLPTTYYSVIGLKAQGGSVPNDKEICKTLIAAAGGTPTVETLFYVTGTWKALGNCPGTLPTANIVKKLTGVLELESSSVPDLYYASLALSSLGQKLPDTAKLLKNLQAALKKDDSTASLGYAFHIGAVAGGDVNVIFNRIEDAIVQADEVDGKFLQFEGGLSITALIVSGAYKLAAVANKPPPISGEQAVKFANYFLSRRSVQTPKGAHSLLDVLSILTNNKYHIPVVVSLAGPGVVSQDQPKVSVKVTNLLGQPLTSDLSVTVESATRSADDVVVLSKKKFEPTSDKTVFSVNLMDSKPEPGLYRLSVSAVPAKSDPRLVGNIGVTLPLKVMATVTVDTFELGVGDSDQTTQPKFDKVVFPTKLGRVLELDTQQKLVVRFTLKDKNSGKPLNVHQAFLRFENKATLQEIIFVAEVDPNNQGYRFDLDMGAKAADFGQLSGTYSLNLIVGDVILSNSFSWLLADTKLKLALDSTQAPPSTSIYQPKPEIKHLFREPERRPPVVVSTLFTGLVAVPFLILLILWAKLGVNISNFPFSLSALGFHLGLGAIFTLFGFFWLQLNMFQTLKYLLGLGVVTFLSGNQLLARIATSRKKQAH
ncbi:dolichyl-diphosphooligosaccharide--protein glycosyltransferase subunit 2-like [Macrosteles quadrilineatus]|uniref:dolichyl-diphosphooligosaccharide--protein glycosyltransferase subunit 2-like n=1 Tax=Macrosteles quadrilineatus TaxID=74068 RepID=UPI0023E1C567|nr:dolichyl-diphosphooligosaccharide--protein glycosyltransferase subunit 2-like [Macrosteles quadrilineatus]XP_054267713.1 dolichyl-diphosphooligosaccharide--protein glycosyltransferase subunit 2-like [Macrosteles quadrilineatus]